MAERTEVGIQDVDAPDDDIRVELAQVVIENEKNGEKNAENTENRPEDQANVLPAIPVGRLDHIDNSKIVATLTATPGAPLELPTSTDLQSISVFQSHLVLGLADGSLILVLNGATSVPSISFGSVVIPSEALSASLGSGVAIVPAEGPDGSQPPESSGNNFDPFIGGVGDIEPLKTEVPIVGTDGDGDSPDSTTDINQFPKSSATEDDDGANVSTGTADGDVIIGHDAADTFVIDDASAVDVIADYNILDGDVVDLSELFDTGGGNLSDFVQLANADTELQVDVDGGGDSFVTVATLDGTAGVNIIYDDGGTDTSGNIA